MVSGWWVRMRLFVVGVALGMGLAAGLTWLHFQIAAQRERERREIEGRLAEREAADKASEAEKARLALKAKVATNNERIRQIRREIEELTERDQTVVEKLGHAGGAIDLDVRRSSAPRH